jgi:hypothetical protein
MKPHELFTLALRLAGLVFLYHALAGLPGGVFRILDRMSSTSTWGSVQNLISLLWPFALAFWFLRGAKLVLRLAYPSAASAE